MATSYKYVNTETTRWTYGAELELSDWPRNERLPPGMAIDENNWSAVNSNGVAVDGPGKIYHLGGEILTSPSLSTDTPAEQMAWVKGRWPEVTHNFRGGLHIHIRVPGLRDNLSRLKVLQRFIHSVMPLVLPVIDVLDPPTAEQHPDAVELTAAKRYYLFCCKSHQTLLSRKRLAMQMQARTPKEFFDAEALHVPSGKVYWATVPRACVNLRQLMQTDTIEFRHFPASSSPAEVRSATEWCKAFLEAAFCGGKNFELVADSLLREYGPSKSRRAWPQPANPGYDHWLNTGFLFTSRHFYRAEIAAEHIRQWLQTPRSSRRK